MSRRNIELTSSQLQRTYDSYDKTNCSLDLWLNQTQPNRLLDDGQTNLEPRP